MNDRFLSMCGLARRAGKIVVGTNMSTSAIRSVNKPALVILSFDASENSRKKIVDACIYHNVKVISSKYSMIELGASVGQKGGTACISINDIGFAETIINLHSDKNADLIGSQEVK